MESQAPVAACIKMLLCWGCISLLAACGPTGWQKPMTSPDQARADLAGCGVIAQRGGVIAAPHPPAALRRLPLEGGDIGNSFQPVPEELLIQQSLRNQCMKERGYRLGSQTATLP